MERPDLCSLEDEIREEKYRDFVFEAEEIEARINRLTEEREQLTAQIRENLTLKKPQMHGLRLKREDLVREKEGIETKSKDLGRMGKQMEEANSNMLSELERKEKMILKY